MVTSALALIDNSQYDLMSKLAVVAAKSGYAAKNEAQVFYLMLKGFELGISPMQALDGIQIISGKPTVAPQLMLALINRSGELEDIKIEDDGEKCTVTMKRKGRSPLTESFSMADAQIMMTKEDGKVIPLSQKFNWRSQPKTMRKWRAIAACARIAFPDVIQGMYTPEEMGATVDLETGDMIEGQVIPTVTEPPVATLPASATPPSPESSAEGIGTQKSAETPVVEALNSTTTQTSAKWTYDRTALLSAIGRHPDIRNTDFAERNNTVNKLVEEDAFAICATLEDAVALVVARIKTHRQAEPA